MGKADECIAIYLRVLCDCTNPTGLVSSLIPSPQFVTTSKVYSF
jgi:hypothetical protein